MTLKTDSLQFAGSLGGFANNESTSFFFNIDAHTLGAGQADLWSTTWTLNNTTDISSLQINYAGLETVWRYLSGALTLHMGTYDVETVAYYQSGQLVIQTYTINQTGGSVSVPAFFLNVRAFLFNAPF
jgi:hypothetical protein